MQTAYADESMRQRPDDGIYVVADVLVPDEQALDVRAELRRLLERGQPRLHWRGETHPRKLLIAKRFAELELAAFAYIRFPANMKKTERERRLCLNGLLWDLRHLGVPRLVIESRGEAADRRDRQALIDARHAKIASPDLRYNHHSPYVEPLLWLPDAVAGAVAGQIADGDSYLDPFGPGVKLTFVDP